MSNSQPPDRPQSEACAAVATYVYEFLDEELEPGLCEVIRAHVVTCDGCAALVTRERRFLSAIERCGCDDAPEPLRDRIRKAIEEPEGAPRRQD